jgi:putative ABC transport system ATP-binding protein
MPERLSGGERQRVAIVAACVHQPDIILADEPTGSLDSTTGEAVLAVLDDLQAETGCTVLMATHDPAVAERCDRRWQLADGRLVAES